MRLTDRVSDGITRDALRVSGIILAFDPLNIGSYAQCGEYDSYAVEIVEADIESKAQLANLLRAKNLHSDALLLRLEHYLF